MAFSPGTLWRLLAPRADILKLLKGPCNLNSFLHLLDRKEEYAFFFLFELLWTLLPSLPFPYIEELFSSIFFTFFSSSFFLRF